MANDLNINVKVNGVAEANNNLKSVAGQTKQTADSLKEFEKVARPLGIALTSVGAAGLMAAHATKDWNNTLGETLQKMVPVFATLTGVGTALMVGTKAIKAYRTAMAALQATTFSAAGVMGVFGASLGAVGLLVYGLTQLFPAMKADTERWNSALKSANDSLKELEENGEGSSAEANLLRTAIDDLTISLSKFSKVGDDNVVTANNLDAALEKLAESTRKLNQVNGEIPDNMQRAIDSGSRFGDILERLIGITVGDTATDVIELTTNILELKDAQVEEYETIRDDAVSALEDYYGMRSFQTKSLIEQFEDETEARQDALNEQLKAVRENTSDVIAQYQREYNARVKLLDDETEATIDALQEQLDALDAIDKDTSDAREDAAFEDEKARIEKELDEAWTRKDKARLEDELADLLENRAEQLADRERQAQRTSLQQQIRDVQDAANDKKEQWQEELDANVEAQNAILAASELTIESELTALENALITKRNILQQELNDAVAVQNAIRDNAIAAINTVIAAQINAAQSGSVPLSTQGAIDYQSGIDYENWAASTGGGVRAYASGGPILEPTLLSSLRTGRPYAIAGERGPEYVTPGGGDVNITGTFYIREEADISKVARELHRLRMRKGNMGS